MIWCWWASQIRTPLDHLLCYSVTAIRVNFIFFFSMYFVRYCYQVYLAFSMALDTIWLYNAMAAILFLQSCVDAPNNCCMHVSLIFILVR